MKLRIMSDLHLEFKDWVPPPAEADVVVIAGDAHMGINALPWIERHFNGKPVVYICGNHEYYGHNYQEVNRELASACKDSNIHFLSQDTYIHDDVAFIGATLWTDFRLDNTETWSKRRARDMMNDYYKITFGSTSVPYGSQRRLDPDHTQSFHLEHKDYIKFMLETLPSKKRVVVTHHLPSVLSIDNDYRTSDMNPAYASNLEELMYAESAPVLWIHGHTHRSKDYVVGNTRVVCNPRGYVPHEPNRAFVGDLVVTI